ncbi:GNAT family N-acetyltransferase [Halobacillus fulvus]|nr:GNAT family N-acetyltransferase [Halobacillus fulvus]
MEYKPSHRQYLISYHLPEDQQEFTSLPLQKIDNPHVTKSSMHVLIMDDQRPVGYFALEDGDKVRKYSDNPHAMVLTSFSIEADSQGKGFAKQALKLLSDFVKDSLPHVDEVVLGVNKRNLAAANLYLTNGFVDEDEVYVGSKGPQHVLHLYI